MYGGFVYVINKSPNSQFNAFWLNTAFVEESHMLQIVSAFSTLNNLFMSNNTLKNMWN